LQYPVHDESTSKTTSFSPYFSNKTTSVAIRYNTYNPTSLPHFDKLGNEVVVETLRATSLRRLLCLEKLGGN